MNIEELYKSIAPKLTNWLVSTGSPYQVACDLVQDVFLKLWKMRDDLLDNEAAVSGLAFTMAKNLRKNLYRDNSRVTFTDEVPDVADSNPSVAPDRLTDIDAAYLRNRLSKAFAELPPPLREAYTLFQIGNLSVRDIASQTGVSENLVKVRIFRAKQRLQQILSDLNV